LRGAMDNDNFHESGSLQPSSLSDLAERNQFCDQNDALLSLS
jgi:hypothetical protein